VDGLKVGQGWNKGLSKANGDKLDYGRPRSEETKRNISKGLKKVLVRKGENKICPVCGKEFYVFPSSEKFGFGKHCSRSCSTKDNPNFVYRKKGKANHNWRGGEVKQICLYCGKEYEVMHAKCGIQKYCSNKCKGEVHRERMVNNPPFVHTFNTDIELLLKDYLIAKGITFIQQKSIEGFTIPDFFIEPNICVYADGDYWHEKDKVKERDKRINKKLREREYIVIRILGSVIKKGVYPRELTELVNKQVQQL
jgi:G:T-mismatch repair DNA endonuclease (very short patch repair protein)